MRCWSGGGRTAGDRDARRVQGGLECRLEAGHGEQRTSNIRFIIVALEVSKLSGWLNADNCRESNGGHTVLGKVRAGRREAAGERAGEGLTAGLGAGHGEERT